MNNIDIVEIVFSYNAWFPNDFSNQGSRMTIPSSNVVSAAGLLVFRWKTAWKASLKPCPALGYSTFSKRFSQTNNQTDPSWHFLRFFAKELGVFSWFSPKKCIIANIDPNWGVFSLKLVPSWPRSSGTTLWVFVLRTFSLYWSAVAWFPQHMVDTFLVGG